ncbi:MAG: DNA repair protein RecN [Bacteroidaceae bacterium]|nr:DNA repair protein RecN [Bacteroidaceae bacterium]
MLKRLEIYNYALIERLDVNFSQGFSVITGETGTGKSVLLGAISMMLGHRSDTKMVRDGADKCIIEGCFDIEGYNLRSFFDENELEYDECDCIVRREVSATGRSRAFINDTPVSVSQLKELGNRLIDIHSQHQNLLLGNKDFQLDVLDTLADNNDVIKEYSSLYHEYTEQKRKLESLKKELESKRRNEDYIRFQLSEIEELELHDGEQEELEVEQSALSHAEDIQVSLSQAMNLLDGDERQTLVQSLREASNSLARVAMHYPPAAELAERLETNYIELKDCCTEIARRVDEITFSPDRLESVTQRLSLIYDLQKKHGAGSVGELLQMAGEWRASIDSIDNGEFDIQQLEKSCSVCKRRLLDVASDLTCIRKKAAQQLKDDITEILVTLGMPVIRFDVNFTVASEPVMKGVDIVEFLFSANSISPMQPLSEVASGGEMARVMLALKSLIADKGELPTLIFDEIDTGISGIIAERMGRLMLSMGSVNRQIVSITHLPQVAALGQSHYKVYKEEDGLGTRTSIVELKGEERVREIAQMMSGEQLTDAALDNARLLLNSR